MCGMVMDDWEFLGVLIFWLVVDYLLSLLYEYWLTCVGHGGGGQPAFSFGTQHNRDCIVGERS